MSVLAQSRCRTVALIGYIPESYATGAGTAIVMSLGRVTLSLEPSFDTRGIRVSLIDLHGFVANLKDHVSEHGFHVHGERHFVETYSNRQTWEVDLHPDDACGGPLDMVLCVEAESRTLLTFEDDVNSRPEDEDPDDAITVPMTLSFVLPPLHLGPDLLVLATDLAAVGGHRVAVAGVIGRQGGGRDRRRGTDRQHRGSHRVGSEPDLPGTGPRHAVARCSTGPAKSASSCSTGPRPGWASCRRPRQLIPVSQSEAGHLPQRLQRPVGVDAHVQFRSAPSSAPRRRRPGEAIAPGSDAD